jgi:hypothetical protein
MDGKKQRILLVWMWGFSIAQGAALVSVIRVFPPPSATWTAERVAQWYQGHSTAILAAAMLLSWTSAPLIQFSVVLWHQARRVEIGAKIWSTLILIGVSLTSVFIAILGMCFGTAAYSPYRAPEITEVMHQFGVLFMVTTEQFFIAGWVGVALVCFTTPDRPDNPFPLWWGWTTVWAILLFEPGAVAFLFKTGPLSINGIFAFWIPAIGFALWTVGQTVLIWRALRIQDRIDDPGGEAIAADVAGGHIPAEAGIR